MLVLVFTFIDLDPTYFSKYLAHLTGRKDYYLKVVIFLRYETRMNSYLTIKVEKIMQTMYTANVTDGMFPTMWDGETLDPRFQDTLSYSFFQGRQGSRRTVCPFIPPRYRITERHTAQFSVGAFADSAHEYLLKQWLLTGKSEPKIRDLCTSSPPSPEVPLELSFRSQNLQRNT